MEVSTDNFCYLYVSQGQTLYITIHVPTRNFNIYYILLCSLCVCVPSSQDLCEGQMREQFVWVSFLLSILWVPEKECMSSGFTARTFTCWAILLGLHKGDYKTFLPMISHLPLQSFNTHSILWHNFFSLSPLMPIESLLCHSLVLGLIAPHTTH